MIHHRYNSLKLVYIFGFYDSNSKRCACEQNEDGALIASLPVYVSQVYLKGSEWATDNYEQLAQVSVPHHFVPERKGPHFSAKFYVSFENSYPFSVVSDEIHTIRYRVYDTPPLLLVGVSRIISVS